MTAATSGASPWVCAQRVDLRPAQEGGAADLAAQRAGTPGDDDGSRPRPGARERDAQREASIASPQRRRTAASRSGGSAARIAPSSCASVSVEQAADIGAVGVTQRAAVGASVLVKQVRDRVVAGQPGDEDAAAAGALGGVLGGVGGAQQVGGAPTAAAQHRDAARDAERRLELRQPAHDAVSQSAALGLARARHQDAELVAADAADERARYRRGLLGERRRRAADRLVAGLVALVVVDVLEVVEVEHREREVVAFAPRLEVRELEALVERAPVREAGQAVAARELRDLREDLGAADRAADLDR